MGMATAGVRLFEWKAALFLDEKLFVGSPWPVGWGLFLQLSVKGQDGRYGLDGRTRTNTDLHGRTRTNTDEMDWMDDK
jgi:hypothetical protein